MTATTAKGFPYPEPTDRVTDGAAAMQDLAEAVDAYLAAAFPPAVYDTNGDAGDKTGVNWAEQLNNSGDKCEVIFTAPTSGRALVAANCLGRIDSGNPGNANVGIRIRKQSDNSVIYETAGGGNGSVSDGASPGNTTRMASCSFSVLMTGLTPGVEYRAIQIYRTTDSSTVGSFDAMRIQVMPA